jgi:glycerol 2-dehydrogenase (NADP+)
LAWVDGFTIIQGISHSISIGTWKSKPGDVEHAVEFALKHGYRHIDTAADYGNETEVGVGIKRSGVPRSEIFLTTKLGNGSHKAVAERLETSLKNLGTDYLDLCKLLLFFYLQ